MRETLRCRAAAVAPGDYVLLTVTDTGCGMDEHTLEHLFDRFLPRRRRGRARGWDWRPCMASRSRATRRSLWRASPGRAPCFTCTSHGRNPAQFRRRPSPFLIDIRLHTGRPHRRGRTVTPENRQRHPERSWLLRSDSARRRGGDRDCGAPPRADSPVVD